MFSSHGGFLTIAMYHHRETRIRLTHYYKTEKRTQDSQTVRAKENLKLSLGGPTSLMYYESSKCHQEPVLKVEILPKSFGDID